MKGFMLQHHSLLKIKLSEWVKKYSFNSEQIKFDSM